MLHHPLTRSGPNVDETWAWVEQNRTKYNIITEFASKQDVGTWSRFLQQYWRKGDTIIHIGHDVVPADGMVEALLSCPYDLCAQAAYIYPSHTGLPDKVIALRNRDATGSLSWIPYGAEWSDTFNLELTKFTPKAQELISVPMCHWQVLDNEMSKTSSIKCHVHWPDVKHNSY